jgi:hypothetical protein
MTAGASTGLRADLLPGWADYATAVGLTLHGVGLERRARCGIHGGARDSLAVNVETGAWLCHACGASGGDVLDYHRASTGAGFVEAAQSLGAWCEPGAAAPRPLQPRATRPMVDRRHECLSAAGRALWAECAPLAGTALAYLRSRRCVIPPADGDLRWHPALEHPSGHVGPALVAQVTDALDCRHALTLHRTWICADGRKAEVTPPRMLLRAHRKNGGCVRLWGDDFVIYGLGIAEGIESALSLAHAFQPVWAAIDAGNLGALPVIAGLESLVVGVDADPSGRTAAQACAQRWTAAGCEVFLVEPEHGDLNDLVTAEPAR